MANIDDIEDNTSENSPENKVIPPLGEVLAEARLAKKLTQKDASDFLRYSVAQVNSLENNQLDVLPQAMITRGFIRNYARYLELDAEPLLASYKLRVPNTTPNTVLVGKSDRQIMLTKESQPWLTYILGTIVLLLFLLTWLISVEYLPKDFFQSQTGDKGAVGLVENAIQPLPQPVDALATLPENAATLSDTLEAIDENGLANTSAEPLANQAPSADGTTKPIDSVNALTATTSKAEALVSASTINAAPANASPSAGTSQPVAALPATNAALVPSKPNVATVPNAPANNTVIGAAKSSVTTSGSSGAINPTITNNKPTTTSVAAVKQSTSLSVEKTLAPPSANLPSSNLNALSSATVAKTVVVANGGNKALTEKPVVEKPAGNQQVNLSISEQTWVQVTDKNGTVVYERILAAGAQESIGGPKPLNLIIGNAKATKLSFMGKAVDLKPYTTENNVARVRLE